MVNKTKNRVLIVGGGFGGVKAALILSKNENFEVVLISASKDLVYYPTLYHMATSYKGANSLITLDKLFSNGRVKVVQDYIVSLDRKTKTVSSKNNTYNYDTLILALGVVTNYFGIEGMEENSFSIKSHEEIDNFKAQVHKELVENNNSATHFMIIGAGPTGIELAGSLPFYLKNIILNHGLKHHRFKISLVEAAPKLLPNLPKDSSKVIKGRLKRLHINIMEKSTITKLNANEATINNQQYKTSIVVWTAGVSNNPFFKNNNFSLLTRGKVAVNSYLGIGDDIYVIGDNADTPYSGMAQTAIWDAEFVANNLIRKAEAKDMKSYKVKKPITIIPVGPRWAALIWRKVRIYGYGGWLFRNGADLVGLHDLEAWDKVSKQIIAGSRISEKCPVCRIAEEARFQL